MQIHKKDIVWPEAGVVRKREREWRQRGRKRKKREEKTFSLASLSSVQSLQCLSVSCFHGEKKNCKEGRGEYFFLKQKLEIPSKPDHLGELPQLLIN